MESVIIKIGDVFHKHHFSNADDSSVLTIGRAFTNDVIVSDPYVGPSQIQIKLSTNDTHSHDWHVCNVDDTNPVFLNKKINETPEFYLSSGDEITIGRTSMTFFKEDHAIQKTREFSFTNWLHHHKFKPLIASVMLMLLFVIALWMSYQETSSELDWGELSGVAIVFVIFAIIWASGWSLTGRLLKSNHYFFSQLFFTSICLSVFLLAGDLYSYVDYFFSSSLAGEIVDWLTTILFFGLLIGFNLTLITHAPGAFRKGLIASAIFLGVIVSLVHQNKDEYSNQPVHSGVIKPSYVPTTAVLRIDNYIDNYNVLFDRLSSVAE